MTDIVAPADDATGCCVNDIVAASPACVTTFVVPVIEPVVAVTACVVPATVPTVKTTVAIPLAFVVVVVVGAPANEPPLVVDQITTWPDVATGLLFASASCALIVVLPPAFTGTRSCSDCAWFKPAVCCGPSTAGRRFGEISALRVTRYFAGRPGTDKTFPPVPVSSLMSVAVKMNVSPDVVPVVKTTVAMPLEFVDVVADVGEPPTNEPPTGVFVHVTITPLGVDTAFPCASTNRALIVTGEPAMTDGALLVTT